MGRSSGGRSGRSGRGRGRGYTRKFNSGRGSNDKKEYKFKPHGQGKDKQSASYAKILDQITTKIQASYANGYEVAKAIKDKKEYDFEKERPKLELTEEEKKNNIIPREKELMYEKEIEAWLKRRNIFDSNWKKAYSFIYQDYCTTAMKNAIQELPDFEMDIENDPLKLLNAVQKLMHTPMRAIYPFMGLIEALARLLNMKQYEDEKLFEYGDRFKQERQIVRSLLGKEFLERFIENTEEYQQLTISDDGDVVAAAKMKDGAFEKFMTTVFLRGAYGKRYGSLMDNYRSQYAGGRDHYPAKFQDAMDALRTHKSDDKKDKKPEKKKKENNGDEGENATSFAQRSTERRCYACGTKEHMLDQCPHRDNIPRNSWYDRTNREYTHHQSSTSGEDLQDDVSIASDADVSVTSNTSAARANWCGTQVHSELCLNGNEKLKTIQGKEENTVILDSGSTISLFKSRDLLTDIRKAPVKIELDTNAGSRLVDQVGEVSGVGTVYFNNNGIANIFALKDLIKTHRVRYDSKVEDAFIVEVNGEDVKFTANDQGLYVFHFKKTYIDNVKKHNKKITGVQHLQSMKKQLEGFTKREVERADRARKFYHMVGAPTLENLKMVIRQNLFKNCPVTSQDVNLAEKIFGSDISTLKGRTTRPRPEVVVDDSIDIPEELIRENEAIDLAIDLIFINRVVLMTAIDRTVKYRSVVPLENQTKNELYRGLDVILRLYNKAGFKIGRIFCDNEFRVIMDPVADEMDAEMIYSAPDQHVPDIERNNRVLKERFRIAYYRLPYTKIPRIMIRYLAMICARQLNLFPAKHGVSSHYSPHMIVTGRNFDYEKQCVCEFGTHVQGTAATTNTNLPRTVDAIYLRPTNSIQGGHELMNLSTGKLITCAKVKPVAMTELVLKAVENFAALQGFRSLKFFNRKKEELLFLDSDLITGVDGEANSEDSDDDDELSSDEESEEDSDDEVEEDEVQELISDMQEDDQALPGSLVEDLEEIPLEINEEREENIVSEDNEDGDDENEEDDESSSEEEEENIPETRPSRSRDAPERLDPTWGGKSYAQTVKDGPDKRKTNKKREFDAQKGWIQKKLKKKRVKSVRFEDQARVISHRSEACHNLVHQSVGTSNRIEYDNKTALYMARTMDEFRSRSIEQGLSFAQQYTMKKGIKKFGEAGKIAATKEADQLYKRETFRPILVKDLSPSEKRRAQESFMFLTEKRDGSVKGRLVYNGAGTRSYITKEDSASPTVSTESLFITSAIDAHEGRDVLTADVPNAFVQTKLPDAKMNEDRVTMKITGELVDMMVELNPNAYSKYVVREGKRKVIYVVVLRALYGMLVASLLWYAKFRKDLESIGFVFNPYDPCVANRMKNEKQQTIRFHVDDIMSSHVDKKVNDKFLNWLNRNYGKLKPVSATRGKSHEYLGMTVDFNHDGKVKFRMEDYVQKMIDEYPVNLRSSDTAMTPASNTLFEIGNGKLLGKEDSEIFHTFIAKSLYLCKRARPDIQPTVAVLATRVQKPNSQDWQKLLRLMKYLNGTKKYHMSLKIDNMKVVKWYVDASFAVHPDFRSHTGGVMKMGTGAIQSISSKQKLNTRSSTEAEIVGVDDAATKIFWTKLFIEAQGYAIEKNILYQDNKSAILLETNGRKSAGKRSRAMNIRYFFITDQVEKGNATVEHCPTDAMVGDFMTKPLQGTKFREFRKDILGM